MKNMLFYLGAPPSPLRSTLVLLKQSQTKMVGRVWAQGYSTKRKPQVTKRDSVDVASEVIHQLPVH